MYECTKAVFKIHEGAWVVLNVIDVNSYGEI